MKNISIALLAASVAGASGLPGILLEGGGWTGSPSARALAMGRAEFMDASAIGSLTNPAAASLAAGGLAVQLSGGLDMLVERRTRTVYDSFGSSIGEAEHAFNRSSPLVPGAVAATLSGVGGMPDGLSLAFGWVERASFAYVYDRTVTNDYYVTIGQEELSCGGFAAEACASASLEVSDAVTVGIGGGWLHGFRDVEWDVSWVDPSVPDIGEETSSDLSGFTGRISVALSPREDLGVDFGAEKTLSASWDGDTGGDLSLPPRLRLGFSWLPGNALRTRFTAEGSYYAASNAEFDGADMGLRDGWSVSTGIENLIPRGPACRFGFRYDRSPVSRALDTASFTGGMGFELGEWAFDAGACFTPSSWDQQDLPGLVSFDDGDSLRVEETGTMLMLSASRAFEL